MKAKRGAGLAVAAALLLAGCVAMLPIEYEQGDVASDKCQGILNPKAPLWREMNKKRNSIVCYDIEKDNVPGRAFFGGASVAGREKKDHLFFTGTLYDGPVGVPVLRDFKDETVFKTLERDAVAQFAADAAPATLLRGVNAQANAVYGCASAKTISRTPPITLSVIMCRTTNGRSDAAALKVAREIAAHDFISFGP